MFKNLNIVLTTLICFCSCTMNIRSLALPEPEIRVQYKEKILSLPLEKYVAHVLAGEVSPTWPENALKAQAIAIRTYALKRMKERSKKEFHVASTIMDQVFKKTSNETFIKAAKETRGLVVTINDDIAETSFHSTCGGNTTNAKAIWGTAHKHLQGVTCGFCQKSPTFTWHADVSLNKLEEIFMSKIKTIKIISKQPDGRANKLLLAGSKNIEISAHQFRLKMGPMLIKSTYFTEIKTKEKSIFFKGQGFGHGVGMCQYGALGMAKVGKKDFEIISHYYPGTKIKRIY